MNMWNHSTWILQNENIIGTVGVGDCCSSLMSSLSDLWAVTWPRMTFLFHSVWSFFFLFFIWGDLWCSPETTFFHDALGHRGSRLSVPYEKILEEPSKLRNSVGTSSIQTQTILFQFTLWNNPAWHNMTPDYQKVFLSTCCASLI